MDFPPRRLAENRTYRASCCWHIGAGNLTGCIRRIPIIPPAKRFPIFPLRERILSVRGRVRWERAARTVTTPNNFPWSYFQQEETSNWLSTYPNFNLPPPRPRCCRPFSCPFLFPSVRSLSSSLHVSFDSFRSSSYFPRRPWTISALLRFRVLLSFRYHYSRRYRPLSCSRIEWNLRRDTENAMKGPMFECVDRVIILL